MVIRRTDSRRRRVVIEEATSQLENGASELDESVETEARTNRKQKQGRNYLPGAQRRHQPKSTDWIPKRPSSVAIFMTTLFAIAAAIVGATWLVPGGSGAGLSSGIQERLSVHGSSSLSVWFSTVLFLVSGLASLQIHALRQHRSNDYAGTYRIWLFFAGLLILASINCVVDFGGLLQEMAGRSRNGTTPWTAFAISAAQFVALGVIFVRGMVEVRKSPASLAVICLVWLAYSVALALRVPGIESQMVQDDGFSAASLNLFATTGTLAAIVIYARHVYLRANGLVAFVAESAKPKRKPKAAKKPSASRSTDSPEDAANDSKPVAKKKPRKTTAPKPAERIVEEQPVEKAEPPRQQPMHVTRDRFAKVEDTPVFQEEESSEESPIRKLSKSERKQMKKLQRSPQDRRAA